ncbi:unnamed protein product [Aureobasidium pullulans]|nr:unnamed protein product [Aureobasidium pullulans]CAD0053770.1 unnamed protein product [Aureobasidium pullulans]
MAPKKRAAAKPHPTKIKDEDYDEDVDMKDTDADDDFVVPDDDEMIVEDKPAPKKRAAAKPKASTKRKSKDLDTDEEEEKPKPKKPRAAPKKKEKDPPVEDSAELKAILDDIPLIQAPEPPKEDGTPAKSGITCQRTMVQLPRPVVSTFQRVPIIVLLACHSSSPVNSSTSPERKARTWSNVMVESA